MSGQQLDPLNLFFRDVKRRARDLFGNQSEYISEQEALHYLGALVENGKGYWLEFLRKHNVYLPDPEGAIADLFACINEDSLFTDPSFSFSLRIALCRVTLGAIEEKGDFKALLHRQIDEIFPEELRERIYRYVLGDMFKDHDDGKNIVPSQEEVARHFEERRKTLGPFVTQTPTRSVINLGTDTWMEACPNCGLEKRCDKRTKRFRCKTCGFDQPYPFRPAL